MTVAVSEITDQVVQDDGCSVVLVGQDVLVLSAMASFLVGLLRDRPQTLEAIAEQLEAEYGAPPEGTSTAAARLLVDALVLSGVLHHVSDR